MMVAVRSMGAIWDRGIATSCLRTVRAGVDSIQRLVDGPAGDIVQTNELNNNRFGRIFVIPVAVSPGANGAL